MHGKMEKTILAEVEVASEQVECGLGKRSRGLKAGGKFQSKEAEASTFS